MLSAASEMPYVSRGLAYNVLAHFKLVLTEAGEGHAKRGVLGFFAV